MMQRLTSRVSQARTGLSLLLLLASACTKEARRPSILIVVLDTVRADRLTSNGYDRPTSLSLDALLPESSQFHNAYATSSWTGSSHASLFTVLFPMAPGTTQENRTLRQGLSTLAERLTANGYRSLAVVENPTLSDGLGYSQGFESWHETWVDGREGDQYRVLRTKAAP